MEADQIQDAIGAHPLLGLLDASLREHVVRASRVVSYRAGRTFHKEGDPPEQAHFLLSGAVRVHMRGSGGRELLLELFRAPALFAEMEVIAQRPYIAFIATLEPSSILHVPSGVFLQLLDQVPSFTRAVVSDLASRLWVSTASLTVTAFADVNARLAGLLLIYARSFGQSEAGGIRLSVRLTQDAMARDLGVSRKAVVKSLAVLKRQGVLKKSDARYVITDLATLERHSHG